MNKVLVKNAAVWDYEIEVVETRALWERYKGVALTYRSASVDFGRKLWLAHQAMGGSNKPGRKKNVPAVQKNVPPRTITDFIDSIGMPRQTFYDFITRIRESIESGVDLLALPEDMKLVEAAAPKSQQEVELEEKIANQEEEIDGRDEAIQDLKEDIAAEKDHVENALAEIEKLKAESEKGGKPDPALRRRIAELEKREKELAEEVDWLSSAVSFKNELRALISAAEEMTMLGKRVLRPKVKQSNK